MESPSSPEADRRSGSLVGQALGDALGFLVEGHAPAVCEALATAAFMSDEPPAAFGLEFGQYSDDTQLARELARSLSEHAGWRPEDYARRIADLFATDRIVGRGRATEAAARRLLGGVAWDAAGEPAPSAGNGAAMRAGPVGLFCAEPTRRARLADEQARITHLDPRSRAAAVLVADVVADALQQPDASLPVGSIHWCEVLARRVEGLDPALALGVRALPRWLVARPEVAAQEIARAGDVPLGAAHAFERWHGISPFATPSALYALFAYARTPIEPEQVLRSAVAVGGDVDTVAAMAGAMVGARVGWTQLGARLHRWAERLTDAGEWGLAELGALGTQCDDRRRSVAFTRIDALIHQVHRDLWSFGAPRPTRDEPYPWLTEREPFRARLLDVLEQIGALRFALDGVGLQLRPDPLPACTPFDTWAETWGPVSCTVRWSRDIRGLDREGTRFSIARVARERGGFRVVALGAGE